MKTPKTVYVLFRKRPWKKVEFITVLDDKNEVDFIIDYHKQSDEFWKGRINKYKVVKFKEDIE